MPRHAATPRQSELEALSKQQLHGLADGLFLEEPLAVERCVEFVLAETQGVWHGRARAMMCRRLKHCALSERQSQELVACIMERLAGGTFSEQFKDQLRLAMHVNQSLVFQRAHGALSSNPTPHVRRYAQWVLSHERATSEA